MNPPDSVLFQVTVKKCDIQAVQVSRREKGSDPGIMPQRIQLRCAGDKRAKQGINPRVRKMRDIVACPAINIELRHSQMQFARSVVLCVCPVQRINAQGARTQGKRLFSAAGKCIIGNDNPRIVLP